MKTVQLMLLVSCVLLVGCASQQEIAMQPATVLQRDVFTCKGLTKDKHWIGITDQFMPDQDTRVVVVAQFAEEDKEAIINYELRNPMNNVVLSEEKRYPQKNPLGIYFEMDTLMDRGGEGEWVANVFADGRPIGQSKFYLGEKPADVEEIEGPRYYIVGEEETDQQEDAAVLSDEERFADYIREVTPAIDNPMLDSSRQTPSDHSETPPSN